LRPLKREKKKNNIKKKGKGDARNEDNELANNPNILPQQVRQQLVSRGGQIKMTGQIKRPYQCVVRYDCFTGLGCKKFCWPDCGQEL
jgi:hypothetical protein